MILNVIGMIFGIGMGLIVIGVLIGAIYNIFADKRSSQQFYEKLTAFLRSIADGSTKINEDPSQLFHPIESGVTPALPMICIGKRGEVELLTEIRTEGTGNLLGAIEHEDEYFRLYAADGSLWRNRLIFPPIKAPKLMKLLAYTVYNPPVKYRETWHREDNYTFYELQELLCLCVEADDDCLTQFIEHDNLTKLIREAATFDQLYQSLDWAFSEEALGEEDESSQSEEDE